MSTRGLISGSGDFASGSLDEEQQDDDQADRLGLSGGAGDFADSKATESSSSESGGSNSSSSDSSGIDWDAYREDVQQESTIKVGGEVVQDNEKGVETKGPVDATDPTSIYEASADNLEASGVDESGNANDEEDVQQFISTRNQSGSNQSGGSDSSESNTAPDPSPSAPESGEMAGLDALTNFIGDEFRIPSVVRRNVEQVVVGLVVAAVAAYMLGGGE
jgi:hypothetical protein